ncbi:TPA: SMEK domain-containing protein [Vibrio parahaemolyticus]|uniref:SMEK domain-containing protein n=1 Tax=Vibrio parahaemolyticus TaxID=670 RepID=UPI001124A379|nr:SMEK domain-containing protein [Vibrio parahaemolyticus]EII2984466.1 SMEK domain-containing protein [Vibrio parahaemolyticus]EJG0711807.1 SMEK domain-containing protein [Vibrio parahaemolyticus]TNY52630.1 hypothetical protein CGK67_23035 [Vibrio parahaemolyticus]HAS6746030.1 SMEK domain-containing protein [Vibrio parahaemolyticus]HAS6766031.1 SMEK domain-containing protein [Vibrio parahaemolyticus]
MSKELEIKKSIDLITFLQRYIENNVKQSFNDISFSIEVVVKETLTVLDNSQYINLNDFEHNYPAIDLLNEDEGIAVQVTTNANMKKVNHTVEMYEKHGMKYNELIVFGFLTKTRTKTPKAKIVSVEYLINKIKASSYERIVNVNTILQREIPFHRLSPLNDKHCLEVVLSVIDRSAIKDMTHIEGCYHDMVVGLKEIVQIIYNGEVKEGKVCAKPLVRYSDDIQSELEEIVFEVNKIIRVVNKSKNRSQDGILFLSYEEKASIDKGKISVAKLANILAKKNNIVREIIVG